MPADNKNDRRYMLLAMRIVGELSAIIALPVVLFAYIGTRLDTAYGTRPRYVIMGFVLAAVLSALAVYGKAKRFAKEYQEIEGQK